MMKVEDWKITGDVLLSDKVTNALRTLILNQTLKPGSRLIQEEISEKLGVSRMPLRDALKNLAMEGLVEIDSKKGVSVVQMTSDLFNEVYTLRANLEPIAVLMSAKLLAAEDIEELESLVTSMDKCLKKNDTEQFSKFNRLFHLTIRSKANWKHLNRFVETLWNGIPPYTPVFVKGQAEQSHQEHKQMIEVIRQKNWDGLEELSRLHIERSRDTLLEFLKNKEYFSEKI